MFESFVYAVFFFLNSLSWSKFTLKSLNLHSKQFYWHFCTNRKSFKNLITWYFSNIYRITWASVFPMTGCGRVHFPFVFSVVYFWNELQPSCKVSFSSGVKTSGKREHVGMSLLQLDQNFQLGCGARLQTDQILKCCRKSLKMVWARLHAASCALLQRVSDVLRPVAGDALERFLDEKTFSWSTNRYQTLVHF